MTRGEVKALGAQIDRNPELRADWEKRAGAEGLGLPGKKLVRWALDRADAAQVRVNPIARDEAFVCVACGAQVPVGGRRPRDHCHVCLHSVHVDRVPGDRAETCGGLLVPAGVELADGVLMLHYRCAACGALRRNRVLSDLAVPDDAARVRALILAMRTA